MAAIFLKSPTGRFNLAYSEGQPVPDTLKPELLAEMLKEGYISALPEKKKKQKATSRAVKLSEKRTAK